MDHENILNGHLRADFNTGIALGTLVIVDFRQIVVDVYGIILTSLNAFGTGDASHFAVLHHISCRIVGVAGNPDSGVDWNGFDDILRTSFDAGTTVGAFVLIDDGNAILDDDGIEIAHLYAGPQAKAPIGTGFCPSARKCGCAYAIHDAMVLVLVFGLFAVPIAFDISHHDFSMADLDTHNSAYLLSDSGTTYSA